jgi:TadE-like protein
MRKYPAGNCATFRTPNPLRNLLDDIRGSQIVELAVALPLLVVMVVGIFDFGAAFGIKLKVANAAREGARIASVQPSSDLSNTPGSGCQAPASICAVRDAVSFYLKAAKVNDCGLSTANAAANISHSGLAWTFSSTGSCSPGTLTLTIDRGATYSTTLNTPFASPLTVEATRVTLVYPYKWQFNSVVVLLVPGASYGSTAQLASTSIMQNLN